MNATETKLKNARNKDKEPKKEYDKSKTASKTSFCPY
jgi:hypothetical protein